MAVEVKICGVTRAIDARIAAEAGARWVGVVFAASPRMLGLPRAADVLAEVPSSVGRVGVFGQASVPAVLEAVEILRLDAVQLHVDGGDALARALSERGVPLWRVARLGGRAGALAAGRRAAGAAVLLVEARVAGRTGGTGVPLDLGLAAEARRALPPGVRFALSGGLRPETVRGAVRVVRPDIVDVSSGVEAAPGVKDPRRLRAFVREALRGDEE